MSKYKWCLLYLASIKRRSLTAQTEYTLWHRGRAVSNYEHEFYQTVPLPA